VTTTTPAAEATVVDSTAGETPVAAATAVATAVVDTIEASVTAAQDQATKTVEQAMTYTKEQADKMGKQAFRAYEDATVFHKQNVDAVVQSTTILAKGMETLSKAMMAYSQAQYDQGVTVAKAVMGVKSLRELVELQTEYARTSFDAMVAEATKVSEISVKVANEAIEPISARINATVEKLAKPSLAA
jgi:phasin family protein